MAPRVRAREPTGANVARDVTVSVQHFHSRQAEEVATMTESGETETIYGTTRRVYGAMRGGLRTSPEKASSGD